MMGTSFNEAEAFTPRIPVMPWNSVGVKRTCFNEAEAFTPRIHFIRLLEAYAFNQLQ